MQLLLMLCYALFPLLGDGSGPPAPPTAEEVVARYERAVGGKEAFARLRTRVMKGSYSLPTKGYTTAVVVYAKAPGQFAFYMTSGKSTACRGTDGTAAWSRDFSEQGLRSLSGEELAAETRESALDWPMRLRELYTVIAFKGKGTIDGSDAWVVEAVPGSGPAETWYFAADTGLLIRRDVPWYRGFRNAQVSYANYKPVDGVTLPFTIRIFRPSVPMMNVFVFDEIRHNVPLEDARFATPAAR